MRPPFELDLISTVLNVVTGVFCQLPRDNTTRGIVEFCAIGQLTLVEDAYKDAMRERLLYPTFTPGRRSSQRATTSSVSS